MMEYVLQTKNLRKKYRDLKPSGGWICMSPRGSIYGFVGKNGAGKTTPVRQVCGLQEPTSGEYLLYGEQQDRRISSDPESEWGLWWRLLLFTGR